MSKICINEHLQPFSHLISDIMTLLEMRARRLSHESETCHRSGEFIVINELRLYWQLQRPMVQ
jgi:hypothetical protein